MSQCARVLAVLADGQPHTIEEIHDRAGTMRLNSRVAELRKRLRSSGETVVCTAKDGVYSYQLVPLCDPESRPRPGGSSGSQSEDSAQSKAQLSAEARLASLAPSEVAGENLPLAQDRSATSDSPEQLSLLDVAA